MPDPADLDPAGAFWEADQAGVVTRAQLLAAGLAAGRIRQRLSSGRWQVVHMGVYATFRGPLPPMSRVWASVLRCGPGAAAGPRSSLWLARAVDRFPDRLDVVIPADRRVRGALPFEVARREGLGGLVARSSGLPRLPVEEAVLDVAARLRAEVAVVDLVIRVVQRRLTTAGRLVDRLAGRRSHRWRALLTAVLADVETGVRSELERRWLHDVERAHGLPRSVLNRPDRQDGRRCYRDVEYLPWGLVVELDGREAHPDDERFRDRRRDNRVTVSGRFTLRYGWHEVVGDPCGVAAEVGAVLGSLGWSGRPQRCGPRCGMRP